MVDNALALGIRPMQIDAATPLMTAARLRQAETESRATEFQMRQAAIGAEARGLMPFANRPEFAQKWAESVDRLHGQGILDDRSAAQWRSNPSPLVLQSIIAQTSSPELQFRQQEAERAQKNADRSFSLQEQQANAPSIQKTDDGGFVAIPRSGQGAKVIPVEGQATPANPYAAPGGQTEGQANASLYASRMFNSERVLRDVESEGTSYLENAKKYYGGKLGFNLNSPEYQKFDQAKRDFVNATLRRESGAVISEAEFENANKQYFPMPGDSAVVIEQKRRNRRDAIQGIASAAGKNYRPEFVFDQKGNIVPNPALRGREPAPANGAKRVTTKADYDALPSGTPYIAPDGSQRVKQ